MITSVEVPDRFNAATAFVDANVEAGRAEQVAVYSGDQQITYAEVYRNVNRTGHAFRRLGVEMEQRVFLLLLDCPEFVYAFFGAMKIGAAPIPTII
ncbi:MAG: AMP-binding protein [Armatimonadetes bacterium]|nr:AMP-binding protein [Armatimonadota bacterium]